ncbi:MAG: hypothetical protein IJH65_15190 [Methanobrevibacter sp.]|nr:hypothetical protein [Methanobrevibacter sp.]
MKKTTLLILVVLLFFILLGAVSATELTNVTSTEASNLINDDSLYLEDSGNSVLGTALNSGSAVQSDNNNEKQVLASNVSTVKYNTKIETSDTCYSKSGTLVKIVLKDVNGNTLENQNVSLTLNSKTYQSTTQSDGAAYFETPSLSQGKYAINVKYNGDSQYNKCSISTKINVISSIYASNLKVSYRDNVNFTAKFFKEYSKLKNSEVRFTLNGKTYTTKTDSNGIAIISTAGLLPGTYKIQIYNPYSKETVTKTITVDKASTKFTANDKYIHPYTKSSFSVVLKNSKNEPFKNVKVHFYYNNQKVTAKTDANGQATIAISKLSKGTYTIAYKFYGSKKYKSISGSKKLYVKYSKTSLTASDLNMQYNDGSSFSVKATTTAGNALANKVIKFKFNGNKYYVTTDSKGIAKLAIGDLKPGTYVIKSTYSTEGTKYYNTKTNQVIISKQTVTVTANDLVMKYKDGSKYQVTIKNKTGANLKNIEVQFTLNWKTTKVTTDANGVAKLAVSEDIGYYPINIIVDFANYSSARVTKHILVNGTVFSASDMTIPTNTASTFQVKVVDAQGKPVSTTIKFTLNKKAQSVRTDSNGIAKLSISGLAKGTYAVTYTDGTTSGSSTITVVDKVTLKEVITSSQNVKKYIESNGELPNTVKIGSLTYSLADYVYLASQAIINLQSNKKSDITVKNVNAPASPQAATNLGNLYDYLSVAKSIVNTCNSKGTMPNYVSSNLGAIGYNGLVYATARVVAFYGDNSIMPNYVSIKTYGSSSASSLNTKNTIKDLTAYLKASTNCQVGNSKIKSIVNSLTSGLTSDTAKAKAIYNYVRDQISYSFYYDTKYGAVGTLNAKTGNCVDQAHLLIAMYRTAGLAARYVHGTCYFTLSGSTYGHVWAQVLIGDTWIVCDPTSNRNSFGNVVNWNNNNYALHGYYPSISF